jgi:hypothetical protein
MLGFDALSASPIADDTGSLEHNLVAAQTSFALTGQDIALTVRDNFIADDGGFNLTGQAAAVTASFFYSFALSGEEALVGLDISVLADQASFALTGQNAATKAQFNVVGGQGSFTLTGQAVSFIQAEFAGLGSFALDVSDADLRFTIHPDNFDRTRLIYLLSQGDDYTVYIPPSNVVLRTVPQDNRYTIVIPAVNNTIYIAAQSMNDTVYIAA